MHFHKFPHPANFEYPKALTPERASATNRGGCSMIARAWVNDIYHIHVIGKGWRANHSQTKFHFPQRSASLSGNQTSLHFENDGTIQLRDKKKKVLLSSPKGKFFGQSGAASVFEFSGSHADQFYGMGEKWTGLEHSGKTAKFWNTDVWADFHPESYIHLNPPPDPAYVTVPYLILKRMDTYIGFLLDNPAATFISTAPKISISHQLDLLEKPRGFHLGSEEGQPNLFILFGPTLRELTQKLQSLIGATPLPPAWALGYQQCRWGYQSDEDMMNLEAAFTKHEIPVDGFWLDIDYMDRYKVFTISPKKFAKPKRTLDILNKAGRKVVPIIDPGVKREPGYGVYDRGVENRVFCQNPQGRDYVGYVWPGQTVFPDFSLEKVREWWASEVSAFIRVGFAGAWLDMNDPATGQVENSDMLFDAGRKSHSSYHNQYALGMARATRRGLLEAHPDDRPFLLSRSGYTGSNRYTAIWTGDNYSNYQHLKCAIPTTLNLALSGLPFNGPDIGGFGGDTTPELMMDWFKACFLFPFFRNHTTTGSRHQEPWAFDKRTLSVVRRYIRLRYRLLPYLYQLFIEHELAGEAILRPLFYDFPDSVALPLGHIDDQFMVGSHIMQAPFVREKQMSREVVLPHGFWFDIWESKWIAGEQVISVPANAQQTPFFIREGAILPLARLKPSEHQFNAKRVDFHVFLTEDTRSTTRYFFDDGKSFAYKRGVRSAVEITAMRSGGQIALQTSTSADGFGPGDFTFTTPCDIKQVLLNGVCLKRCAAQGVTLGAGGMTTWKSLRK
jgi:alpha-glucosidase